MEPVTIGICAYNEESNIEQSVRSAFNQIQNNYIIEEVIVVSSNSTDNTDAIVRKLMKEFPRLTLYVEPERRGKNSAINVLLENKKTEIVVLLNADNRLRDLDSIEYLVSPLIIPSNPPVGIVGGRPIPINSLKTISGYASHLIWSMHHSVSMEHPKIGELIAFRDIGLKLPIEAQSDEDILKMKLEEAGYVAAYASEAITLNRGSETVKDFMKQRIRVNAGEVYIKENYGYSVPTWNRKLIGRALLYSIKDLGPHPFKMLVAVGLEIITRLRAKAHVRRSNDCMNVWDHVESTKKKL